MMHTPKTEPKLFSLKGFFWLCLFKLLHSDSGILSQELTKVAVQAGDEARLPCKITIGASLESYYIYWQKPTIPGNSDMVVISFKNGKEFESEKDKSYKNRSKIDNQNLTLSISSVTINDSGTYKCIAILQNHREGEASIDLSVITPFSKPIILDNWSSERCDSTNLTLRCLSHGGSSRPEMFGFINKKAVNWTSTVTSNKTLFNITGTLHLNMTENMLVECLVRFSDFHVSTNYSLNLTKNCSNITLPPLPPLISSPFGIIIPSTVILIFLLVVVMSVILQYYFHKHPRSSTTHQSLATDETILQEQSTRQTLSGLGRSPL
ncbi:T-lymphocyte activation antigen CD80-like [Crotalus tigris]|uniref:T-lymphocyte activation antigen CD80-like n=1 Tax=Crotalus tigris TaxID=88082 RepID=UPI00192F67A2|nr:T-lymphocyte activation antigen CD80-like [Crotalus tigris]XP_039189707.1 T-lymphocyte activation antigen CD80-like [Crotalus tigris]XP_039189708.1 T-lymphocyte activation antigen CD80-like [Crotalus tigris]XP_039189709.1 T-lymphocyte activation antigen CD80-like [Crotalus tigris]XP_039189710.1 T-lymphocyte activation antigen CD80-like [Crotalus tigris]